MKASCALMDIPFPKVHSNRLNYVSKSCLARLKVQTHMTITAVTMRTSGRVRHLFHSGASEAANQAHHRTVMMGTLTRSWHLIGSRDPSPAKLRGAQ